ncbi:28622_t:CDS:1, partial [Gigaspora margarita]
KTPNSNLYTKYRSLTETMNYSYNIKAQALYFGVLDTFLKLDNTNNNNSNNNPIYDQTLQCATN